MIAILLSNLKVQSTTKTLWKVRYMDRNEKKQMKDEIRPFIDLGNGRYKDSDVETLKMLVDKQGEYNGQTKTYYREYKTFDSKDTYWVTEKDTYTFRSDDSGIRIERFFYRKYDDGQIDKASVSYTGARDILNNLNKIF